MSVTWGEEDREAQRRPDARKPAKDGGRGRVPGRLGLVVYEELSPFYYRYVTFLSRLISPDRKKNLFATHSQKVSVNIGGAATSTLLVELFF